jgi:hypothetical protein
MGVGVDVGVGLRLGVGVEVGVAGSEVSLVDSAPSTESFEYFARTMFLAIKTSRSMKQNMKKAR